MPASPARAAPSTVRGPIDGKSTRRSWPALGSLDQHAAHRGRCDPPVSAQLDDASEHEVGPFRRLDHQHAPVGYDHGLTDVEWAGGGEQSKALCNVGAIAVARALAAERSFRHQDFRRNFVRPDDPEAVLFENRGDTGEQMIVTAAEDAQDARQQPERREIRLDLPDRRPHQRADEHGVPATLPACEPAEPAELAKRDPVMRIERDAPRISPTANRKKHGAAALLPDRGSDRKGQAAGRRK